MRMIKTPAVKGRMVSSPECPASKSTAASDMPPTATMMILKSQISRTQEWIAERRKKQSSDWSPQTIEAECSWCPRQPYSIGWIRWHTMTNPERSQPTLVLYDVTVIYDLFTFTYSIRK